MHFIHITYTKPSIFTKYIRICVYIFEAQLMNTRNFFKKAAFKRCIYVLYIIYISFITYISM